MFEVILVFSLVLFILEMKVSSFFFSFLFCCSGMKMISSSGQSWIWSGGTLDSLAEILIIVNFFTLCGVFGLVSPFNNLQSYSLALLGGSIALTFYVNSLVWFYLFFESSLLPLIWVMYFWGYQPERASASSYLMIYTLICSSPFLSLLFFLSGVGVSSFWSFNVVILPSFVWFASVGAFFVKVPLYGIHLWLPKAHVEAPVSGSVVLASILLKLGGYGIYRWCSLVSPIMPTKVFWVGLSLGTVGSVFSLVSCFMLSDYKAVIAFSSISHMNFFVASFCTQLQSGKLGGMMMMISHSFTSATLFCLAHFIFYSMSSRSIYFCGGYLSFSVVTAFLWFICLMANIGVPPSMNCIAELLCLTSVMINSLGLTYSVYLFLSAVYSFMMMLRLSQGKSNRNFFKSCRVTQSRELILVFYFFAPVILLMSFNFLI